MRVGASIDENWACSRTQAAIFKTNNRNYEIGIAFENIQVRDEQAAATARIQAAAFRFNRSARSPQTTKRPHFRLEFATASARFRPARGWA